jgi:hypothetical protein
MTQKTTQNPWNLDVRVRERNLKAGSLTDKDVEKYLAQLTDVADQAEPFATPQPALAQPEMPPMAVAEREIEEEEEEEEEEGEAPVAEESAPEVPGTSS